MSRSFLGWVGGKSLLSKTIVPMIPAHTCYVEVFAGASWVLFRKPQSKVEVLNDINKELITLYRVIQYHLDEFVRYCRWVLISRDEFERVKRVDPETLTDIQRAARFYYLVKTCFGTRIHNPTFGTSATQKPRLNLLRIEEELSAAHLRLSNVIIECLPWQKVIAIYDRSETVFYVDPPYYGREGYYGKGIFSKDDFTMLADILAKIKGKFVLSINDTPEIREIFKAFNCRETQTKYAFNVTSNKREVAELLYANF